MFRFALGNLLSRPLRSALAILGLTVAIGGMVGLFSIAGGIEEMVSRTFEQIPGLLIQQRGAPVPIFSTLPVSWGTDLEKIDGVTVVNPEIMTRINIIDGKTIISPPRFLVGMDIESRLRLKRCPYRENLKEGRFLADEDRGKNSCVISSQIAREFKKHAGDSLKIGRYDCEIIGVYSTGSMMLDGNILMDLQPAKSISRYARDSVSCFYVELDPNQDRKSMKARIEAAFVGREITEWNPSALFGGGRSTANPLTEMLNSLDSSLKRDDVPLQESSSDSKPPSATTDHQSVQTAEIDEESGVEIRAAEDWAERFDEFAGDLNIFLTLMTAVGVLIAVLSIVNTMLMSVTERTIEFGILRANGWSQSDIIKLITFESALLGVLGGLLGAVVGWIATQIINGVFSDRVSLFASPQLLLFSIFFSTAMGLLGGVYPAWLAARMSPMEAIRRG